jgi:hypothetical protein
MGYLLSPKYYNLYLQLLDINEYLAPETKAFCTKILKDLGYSYLTQAGCQPDGTRTHRQAYLQLRDILEQHIKLGKAPILLESKKPKGAWDWKTESFRTSLEHVGNDINRGNVPEADICMEGPDELAVASDFVVI